MHDVTQQNVVAQKEHFLSAFVDINDDSGNDVFDVRFCKLTPKRSKVRNAIILMFSSIFGVILDWNQVKYKTCDHAKSCLFHCINICRFSRKMFEQAAFGLVFKQLPRDPANVNTRKNMHDPYIHQLTREGILASWDV